MLSRALRVDYGPDRRRPTLVDRATTCARQARPDYADHYNVRARGNHVKGSDLNVLLSTDDADECVFVVGI